MAAVKLIGRQLYLMILLDHRDGHSICLTISFFQSCVQGFRKGEKLYFAFMDLKKACDGVNKEVLWDVFKINGVDRQLLRLL